MSDSYEGAMKEILTPPLKPLNLAFPCQALLKTSSHLSPHSH